MKYGLWVKLAFINFLFLMAAAGQSQTVSNLSNKTSSNIPSNNTNGANQSNSQTKIPESQTVKFVSADDLETQVFERGGHGTGIFAAKVGLEDLLEQFLTKSL